MTATNTAKFRAAIDYLNRTFAPDDRIFFLAVHSTKKHPDKHTGHLVADVKSYVLVPMDTALNPLWMENLEKDQSAGWNIYVCMNPFPEGSAQRREMLIKTVRNVFIETDRGDALKAIEQAVAENLIPEPHSILQSSPGKYHVVWHVIDVEPADAKGLNRALAVRLGGDIACVDLHRVLRMPGFRNLKYADKPECVLVRPISTDRPYTLDQFKIPIFAPKGEGAPVSENKLKSIVELLERNAAEADAKLGKREDDLGGYRWALPCPWSAEHTAGGGVGMIMLLRDGKLEYSCLHSHCADRGWSNIRNLWQEKVGHKQRFGEREQKKDNDEFDKLIDEFNERYFVIRKYGNKACVGRWEKDLMVRQSDSVHLEVQSIEHFRNGYLNEFVQIDEKENGEPKFDTKANAWIHDPCSRKYDRVVFLPNKEFPGDVLNLWRGFAFKPVKGNNHVPYLEHLLRNVCCSTNAIDPRTGKKYSGPDPRNYHYLIRWMAYAAQHPDEQGQTAVVVRGKKGVGKNVFAEGFMRLFGPHAILLDKEQQATGNFNAHLDMKCVAVLDETFYAASKRQDNILKSMITNDTLNIEKKGFDIVTVPNLLHVIILGNADWLVRASIEERRYFMLTCGVDKIQDTKYFKNIKAKLDDGGYANLLYYLLNLDLSDFDIRNAPHTHDLHEQMASSLEGVDNLFFDLLFSGVIPGDVQTDGSVLFSVMRLFEWSQKHRRREWEDISIKEITNFFRKEMNFKQERKRLRKDGVRQPQRWSIPTLKKCREKWAEVRTNTDWPDDDAEWTPTDEWTETPF